jgi:hypothetical protein
MAKKKTKTTKTSAAMKTAKPVAGKAPTKSRSKKSPLPQHDHHGEYDEDFELDAVERKAVDHIVKSEQARDALEREVNMVVTEAVRKICKVRGKSLTVAQAQNVAMVLFGD